MHPDQYQTTKRSAERFRKPYQTAKILHQCSRCSCSRLKFRCHECRETPDSFRTVYTRDVDHNSDLSPALLRTNKKVRREAHSIFYHENTFFFYSKSAVPPFLKDRTRESPANIKSIGSHLEIDHHVERDPASLDRVRTFREVGRMAGPHLQNPQSQDRGSQM
ncbi:hypothetical protein HO133_009210 [Letharia lupina]|uniref:Uncharacterized protein n=1 Tax=Letharia lupina TaxID=560253 RepID=A0A8H6CN84_9LECA|nr:uncharacterized protein HO133_009210 [Letharia lupina]KAF6226344.1 hypothetical protein HO133_009210 [Letharia lupina]